jgi:hypothetical protein
MKCRALIATCAAAVLTATSGCVAWRAESTIPVRDPVYAMPSIERGAPNKFVDGVGWTLGIPEKVLLWDRRVENHRVSTETEQSIAEYMAAHGLGATKVRINQYAPGDEWRRLVANKKVGAGWRYTFGALRTAGYTVLPGRLIGNDGYNPYTDTVSIYSDIPSLAMEQGAHAHIVKEKSRPGTYASIFSLPILSIAPEGKAKRLTMEHLASTGTSDQQLAGVRTLSPQYGAEMGREAAAFNPVLQPFTMAIGAGVGHATGAYRRHQMKRDAEQLALASAPAETSVTAEAEVAQATAIEPAIRR